MNNPIISLLAEGKIENKKKIINYNFIDIFLNVIEKLKEIEQTINKNK